MHTLRQYLNEHPKKVVIFDFDDTLFTLELPWHTFFDGLVERLRALDPDLHEYHSIVELEHAMIKAHGDRALSIIRSWSAEFEREYLRGVQEHAVLTDFIREEQGYQYFLWTSNMRASVERVLQDAGLLERFSGLVTKDSVRLTKPDPEGFSLIYDDEHAKSAYLFVGDSSNDQGAALAAGIDFFQVNHD